MPAGTSIRRGFEAIARQPALILAEIAWRWCFTVAAVFASALLILEYLNSIPVSWREQLLAETGDPLLAWAAVAHALRGSAFRFAAGFIVAATATAILWMLAAALGRLVTLHALLPDARHQCHYRPLLGLSFLRAALFLAALLAAAGALVLCGFAGPPGDATPSLVFAAVLLAAIWLLWALLNWLLSVSTIFALRDQFDTFGAVAAAVNWIGRAFGDVVLASLPFLLLHYLALAAALAAAVLVFDLMLQTSPQAFWALVAIAFAYFAYADFLCITRLAAYISLAAPGAEPVISPEVAPSPSASLPGAADGQLPATSY